jgi:hypothetical protein
MQADAPKECVDICGPSCTEGMCLHIYTYIYIYIDSALSVYMCTGEGEGADRRETLRPCDCIRLLPFIARVGGGGGLPKRKLKNHKKN